MARCRQCGKKGLFLKLDKATGLCMSCQEAAKRAHDFAERKREEYQNLINCNSYDSVELPVQYMAPCYDLTGAPFGNREYVSWGTATIERETGQIFNQQRFFYADDDALRSFELDLNDLESMLSGAALGIPSLPPLHTDCTLLVPVNSLRELPGNCAKLEILPLTKTGRTPKFPIAIHFSAYELIDDVRLLGENGSHGSLYYLQNKSLGKAEAHYWNHGVYYGIHWKLIGGELRIGSIEYADKQLPERIQIYRSEL